MARKKRKRNASRGSVNNIILKTLTNGDKYGYEIIKEVEEYSDGKIKLKQPSLYSSLSRFEEKKFVTSYWGDSEIGGRRHYYHLTEDGLAYYKKFILKENNEDVDDDEDLEDILESNNINLSNNNLSNDEDEIDIDDENIEDEQKEETSTFICEVPKNEIPAIVDFEPKEPDNNIITDHAFHNTTPMESFLSQSTNIDTNTTEPINNEVTTNPQTSEIEPWQSLANITKKSNKNFSKYNYNKLYIKKPKKEFKIVKDIDGIIKLREENYIPVSQSKKPIIIDNVIKRSKSNNIFGYTSYTNDNKISSTSNNYNELSEEEKLKRNENFLAKFNLLTKSKMKPVSTPAPRPIEPKPEKPIDYRGKLNAIYETSTNYEDELEVEDNKLEENNLFNYTQEDDWQTDLSSTSSSNDITEDEDDKFIEFEATEQFEVKQDNKQYIEEINNYTTPPSQVNMTRYENTTKAVLVDKTYILNNKLKMIFGIIMSLLMVSEITLTWFIFKNYDLISYPTDKTILIITYILIGIFALITILPYMFNSNSHKANNFKFKYSFWFGILTFLVCTILIYCINALGGFELDNLEYFAIKIFIPIVLAFNFVIAPVIYAILVKRKIFYD